MKSNLHGKNTSTIDINTSSFGIWILVQDHEYFLPYTEYPWFQKATISDIHDVKLVNQNHLHWPTLDVDLDLDSLIRPEKYPLIYKDA